MAWRNTVTTSTQDKIMAKLVDTILNSNVFAKDILTKAKPWVGETFKQPIKVSKGAAGQSFKGFDVLSTEASNTDINLSYEPTNYAMPINLPLDELSVNKTATVADMMGRAVASRAQDMADSIGDLFYSDGTGNGSKDFLGLEALVDDGTNVATIGGQSRTTYTTLKSTVTASGGTLTLAKMATLYTAVSSGSIRPKVVYTTEAVRDLYEQLRTPIEQYSLSQADITKGFKMGAGAVELYYKGMPVKADEKCPSGVMYMLNTDYIEFRALPFAMAKPIPYKSAEIDGNDYESSVTGLGFTFSGWREPVNQMTVVGHIILSGNLITSNPKRQGKLTGVTSV